MTRVVVVGNGMVGSRFVEDLLGQPGTDRFEVTVLGAEEYEPYNRVLLSEVVAGAVDVASLTLPRTDLPGVSVRPGTVATTIDRVARTVTGADGSRTPYDVLVLATGARARVPEITGLTGDAPTGSAALPAGVHALRTLDDAREIVAATVNARRAVVLGAGVLGLEAACGLARRGLHVTVVHGGEHLMDRQLDGAGAGAVVHGLQRLGIDHVTGAVTDEVLLADGRLRGLRLRGAHGEVELATDLLVLTAGTLPETGLAVRAGLEVRRGIVVGADGATADPAVHAIGDCAEPPEGSTGLIAQGWDQARRLASRLATVGAPAPTATAPTRQAPPDAPHGTDVVRLKAHGLEVVTMGVRGDATDADGARVVRLSDPSVGRHVELVVADGVLVGATCVGAGALAADLTTAYARRTPVPADPGQLLLRPVRGAAAAAGPEPSPTLMPDRTTVCRCNGVTKGDLVACWRHGARSVEAVTRETRATTGCGGCTEAVCGIVDWLRRTDPPAAVPGTGGDAALPVAAATPPATALDGSSQPAPALPGGRR
ncbi:FAD-dependent oxidoreductase [Actinotalea sp. K2]|uniref:FAD-dependent oxidoreductase n=1 Tax=Actinotalea sp. K2 TaxID=2939438 RepID=UPI002017708A|nr:FAD-dependent oxidoreductase [Actinotalea sp. K2]MCL3862897.1 FAD-dependent oxidoreductase [Actinotalea sp. K2]